MDTRILGTVSMVLAVTMVTIGIPLQIRKNYREKRSGQPVMLTLLIFGAYISRLLYAVSIRAWYIAVPDTLGVALSAVMLVQFLQYRSKQ